MVVEKLFCGIYHENFESALKELVQKNLTNISSLPATAVYWMENILVCILILIKLIYYFRVWFYTSKNSIKIKVRLKVSLEITNYNTYII